MRAARLIAILALASLTAMAQERVTSRATAYRTALEHISKINGPNSSIDIEIQADSGSQRRKQRVKVRGQISAATVAELVHLHLASNKRYFSETSEWVVEVAGDSRFASVLADNQCRDFCRYMTSAAYSFERGKWTVIYEEVLVS